MAIGDAYKPTASKKPAPEPERYEGIPVPSCAGCGGTISGSYVVRGDQRFHANEPACRKAWSESGGGGVLAEERPEPSKMTGPDRGALERARAETPDEAAALDRAGVMSPEARAAVLARQPAPRPTPAETAKHEAPAVGTATGAALDAIGASVGVARFVPVPGDGEPETDAAYRERIARTVAGRIDRSPSLPPNAGAFRTPAPIEALRVYVAGASKEPDRCRGAMKMIERLGGVITLDWLAAIELEGAANEGLNDDKRKRYAVADLEGVESADLIWLLASPLATTGSWTELGAALILRRLGLGAGTIVVSGPARERSIFAALADFETDHDLEALDFIRTKAREKREGLGG